MCMVYQCDHVAEIPRVPIVKVNSSNESTPIHADMYVYVRLYVRAVMCFYIRVHVYHF